MNALAFAVPVRLTSPAAAQDIIGQATVIDGDTLEIHGQRIRLWEIDALESDQPCRGGDRLPYRCGSAAVLATSATPANGRGAAGCHCELPCLCQSERTRCSYRRRKNDE